jgi:hypothetical protein
MFWKVTQMFQTFSPARGCQTRGTVKETNTDGFVAALHVSHNLQSKMMVEKCRWTVL